MDAWTRKLIGVGALLTPAFHTLTDIIEWAQGGFSPLQLWLNYIAILPMPAVVAGLYLVQRPRIALIGLLGALLHGFSFVYFAHTTLVAITNDIETCTELRSHLGSLYAVHGAIMIGGGGLFGWATLRANIFPWWTSRIFLLGLAANLVVALWPVPELLHTLGTVLRNAGLIGMGWASIRLAAPPGERTP